MTIKDIVQHKTQDILKRKPPQKFDWNDSYYEDTQYLGIDERGQLGEEITADILIKFGCQVEYDSSVTESTKGYDLISNGVKIEVKLATITIGTGMFQHENLHPQRDFHAILFIDIAPNNCFLTAVKKQDIIWTNRDKSNSITVNEPRPLHRREDGRYKCDFTIKHIQSNTIPRFKDYKTGEIKTSQDFFDIYKHIDPADQ